MVHNLIRMLCIFKYFFPAGESNAAKTAGVSQPQSLPLGIVELVLTGVRGLPAILIGKLDAE